MSTRQQKGLDIWLKHYQLPKDEVWDFNSLFGREAPVVLEIGFGMGASLLAMAQAHPEKNYIGIEVHKAGVGSLAADLHEHDLSNVKLAADDAIELLKHNIPPASLSAIQIFFPDPWPKKRHHKRRIIQPDFIALLTEKLKEGGYVHCATDWQEYAEQMLALFSKAPGLVNSASDQGFVPRVETRPLTKFEARGQRLGHGIWDLVFIRKNEMSTDSTEER